MKIEVNRSELVEVLAVLMPLEYLGDEGDWCYKPVCRAMELLRKILEKPND